MGHAWYKRRVQIAINSPERGSGDQTIDVPVILESPVVQMFVTEGNLVRGNGPRVTRVVG